MGLGHADNITSGKISRCEITAVCDPATEKTARFPHARAFTRSDELIRSGAVDAVLIATPTSTTPSAAAMPSNTA